MFDNDHEVKAQALNLWANNIESGNVALSRQDMVNQGKEKELPHLSSSQVTLVERLRRLAIDELKLSSKEALQDLSTERRPGSGMRRSAFKPF